MANHLSGVGGAADVDGHGEDTVRRGTSLERDIYQTILGLNTRTPDLPSLLVGQWPSHLVQQLHRVFLLESGTIIN